MNIRYKYPTIPRRDAVIEAIMTKVSESNKDIIDLLIDCNEWHKAEYGEDLFDTDFLPKVSIFMRIKYQKMENWARGEINEYNQKNTTKTNKDSIIDKVFGYK